MAKLLTLFILKSNIFLILIINFYKQANQLWKPPPEKHQTFRRGEPPFLRSTYDVIVHQLSELPELTGWQRCRGTVEQRPVGFAGQQILDFP